MKRLFEYLVRSNRLLFNPCTSWVEISRRHRPIGPVLTVNQIEHFLSLPDTKTTVGMRNRAIMEVLNSTGIRLGELLGLLVTDADLENQVIYVRRGKGSVQRMAALFVRTRAQLLGVLKGFTRYLQTRNCFVSDPGKGLRLPKKPNRLPRIILTPEEVRQILGNPDTNTDSGYRDRVILELLYDTAIRCAELGSILISHLDLECGYIHIRGKGNRHRVVPASKRVCGMVEIYIRQFQPRLLRGQDCRHLILNRFGRRMDPNGIWAVVKRHASRSQEVPSGESVAKMD